MWSETVYVKLKEEGVNSLNTMNMRFILLNICNIWITHQQLWLPCLFTDFDLWLFTVTLGKTK